MASNFTVILFQRQHFGDEPGTFDDVVYSSDLFTWHLQFHGNSTCAADVFLSNGIAAAPATLYALAGNIAAASKAAAAGGPVLTVDVYDAAGDCPPAERTTCNCGLRRACRTRASARAVTFPRQLHASFTSSSAATRGVPRPTLHPRRAGTAAWWSRGSWPRFPETDAPGLGPARAPRGTGPAPRPQAACRRNHESNPACHPSFVLSSRPRT